MALKFQFNKTFLQQLNKDLKVRENALPTLQAKEAALRLEVKKARDELSAVEKELASRMGALEATHRLWGEFPGDLVRVNKVNIAIRRIAGVKTPVFEAIEIDVRRYSLFASPAWFPMGIEILRSVAELRIKRDVAVQKVQILEYARKKTTQKVNLYEKVQIPEYREAILGIKRFLEDEDNLSKSSQKILKTRMAAAELAAVAASGRGAEVTA